MTPFSERGSAVLLEDIAAISFHHLDAVPVHIALIADYFAYFHEFVGLPPVLDLREELVVIGIQNPRGELTPFSKCSNAVLLEDIAAIEVTIVVEMIVDRGVDGGELLQGLDVPERGP